MISLGLDCGTQSTKCIALDLDSGQILASAQEAYGFVPDLPPGAMEQHPEDWAAAAEKTITSVVQTLGAKAQSISCLAVSGQQHGLVLLGPSGQVLRPAKLWCDTSTIAQCDQLTSALGGTRGAIKATGNAVLPGYTSPKLLWVKQNEPRIWSQIKHILLPHDFLNFWLTGVARMEFGDASGTGLLDVHTRTWSQPAIQAIGSELLEWLPPIGSSLEILGEVKPDLAQKIGLPPGVKVAAGGGDNMMGAIGTGNIQPGVVTVSLGTSGTLYAYSARPITDPQGEVAAFCDSTDAWLPLVCTMNVTLVTEHTAALFAWNHTQAETAAATIPPGADGLFLLPFFTGERTPNLPLATGTLEGLTPRNWTPAHLMRAAIEGVTLGLGYGLRRFRDLGLTPDEIRLTGGASKNRLWRQICADIFGVPTVCLQSGEGAALGAALQAAASLDAAPTQALRNLAGHLVQLDASSRCSPNASARRIYQDLQDRFIQAAQSAKSTAQG
jgi:xylulokinase